jgi:hypothetical protein
MNKINWGSDITKKKKPIILPDGTELSQEEFEKMDDRHWWEKKPKESVLGRKHK